MCVGVWVCGGRGVVGWSFRLVGSCAGRVLCWSGVGGGVFWVGRDVFRVGRELVGACFGLVGTWSGRVLGWSGLGWGVLGRGRGWFSVGGDYVGSRVVVFGLFSAPVFHMCVHHYAYCR